jgi:hypothetical protein
MTQMPAPAAGDNKTATAMFDQSLVSIFACDFK